jgi:Zn-dependent protease with chaperone function
VDFFENQDQARRKTRLLVVLFALAVMGIILLVYFFVWLVLVNFQGEYNAQIVSTNLWNPLVLVCSSMAVMVLVALGSGYKIIQLRQGGVAVAEMLGGRLLAPDSREPGERRLLNVVEEMSLASGTPVPPVYVLSDPGINAFAAGYTPDDAVIGVTRGCMELLTRDELQGVMAHEFSHILNGDMRLNIRLMGVVHGILIIGLTGKTILRSVFYRDRSLGRKRGSLPLPLILLGLGLLVAGSLGSFFGNLIKAAVSRQREFLSDAAAVQFTRNPQSIAGALKKIGALGSRVESKNAPEAAHLFFCSAVSSFCGDFLATHPPLAQRIMRIDPEWDGTYPQIEALQAPSVWTAPPGQKPILKSAVSQVGQVDPEHLSYAREILDALPAPLLQAARDPYGSRALLYAMLVNSEEFTREAQLEILRTRIEKDLAELAKKMLSLLENQGVEIRLPLLDLAMPAMKELSPDQYQAFESDLKAMVKPDKNQSLFEWTLLRILEKRLGTHFRPAARDFLGYEALTQMLDESSVLLSAMAHAGHPESEIARKAFEQGTVFMELWGRLSFKTREECDLTILDQALAKLNHLAALEKRLILGGCAACIAFDKKVSPAEGELFRAVSDFLNCPMPPLLPGQPLN